MIRFNEKPFNLSQDQVKWVNDTYTSMIIEEKIGQLFCPIVFTKDKHELQELINQKHIGGILYREGPGEEIRQAHKILQKFLYLLRQILNMAEMVLQ